MPNDIDKRNVFIDTLVNYVESRFDWETLDKREVVVLAANLLVTDVGAAQDFLDACGIDIDLLCQRCKPIPENSNQLRLDLFNQEAIYGNDFGRGTLDTD